MAMISFKSAIEEFKYKGFNLTVFHHDEMEDKKSSSYYSAEGDNCKGHDYPNGVYATASSKDWVIRCIKAEVDSIGIENSIAPDCAVYDVSEYGGYQILLFKTGARDDPEFTFEVINDKKLLKSFKDSEFYRVENEAMAYINKVNANKELMKWLTV